MHEHYNHSNPGKDEVDDMINVLNPFTVKATNEKKMLRVLLYNGNKAGDEEVRISPGDVDEVSNFLAAESFAQRLLTKIPQVTTMRVCKDEEKDE